MNFKIEQCNYNSVDILMPIYKSNYEVLSRNIENKKIDTKFIEDDIMSFPLNTLENNQKYMLIRNMLMNVGVIKYVHKYPEDDTIYICMLLIDTRYDVLEYGRNFLKYFSKKIKKVGYKKIKTSILSTNEKSKEFWMSCGFNIIDSVKNMISYDKDEDVIIFEKIL